MKTQIKTPTWDDVENARDLATGPQAKQPQPDKATLEKVKSGTVKLPSPIYKSRPYVVLSNEDVVLASGTLEEIKQLGGYYGEFLVEVRQYDLDANDNTKIVTDKATAIESILHRFESDESGKLVCVSTRAEVNAALTENAALCAEVEAWAKFKKFYFDDLAKSNPGFLAKLTLQDYGAMNEAYCAVAKADAQLAAVRGGKGISPGS